MSSHGDRRAQRRIVAAIVPGAVAVAALLIALRLHFEPPTIPPYAIVGAEPTQPDVVLTPDAMFEVELRPASPVHGAIGVRGFLRQGDVLRPWDPPYLVSPDGKVRVAGPVRQLFAGVAPGHWEAIFAVGRPELLPTAPSDVLRARRAGPGFESGGWRLTLERVVLTH
jgi:hypothetical protein